MVQKDQKIAVQFALASVLLWSTVATAFKLALTSSTLEQLVVVSSLSSLFVLFVIYAFSKQKQNLFTLFKQTPKVYLLLGNINPVLYYYVLFAAYERLPAQIAQSINYTWGIVLALLSIPILGQKFSKGDAIGLTLCYVGVVIAITRFDITNMPEFDSVGLGLAFLSTLIWSSYWLLNRKTNAPALESILICFICGTPALLFIAINNWHLFTFNSTNLMASVYIALFEMSIAFIFWLKAMSYAIRTAQISSLIYLSPFLSLLLINWVLKEPIYFSTVIALITIMLGLYIQKRMNQSLK
ncbi:hypothetical protein BTO11_13880 [Psychrosphaera saromensis]|uniref:EamA domain-containing protein n=1 Tax=Psychrosphaera saromensis TaxID=716813 RepID=A0A2S7UXA6_9GAMM|nr:hypothetical protein BTO11_13880 [Psychrosphaera saromensis]